MNLVYRNEQGEPASFSLEDRERTTLGRTADRDVVLRDQRVSKLHAIIERVGGAFLLRDCESTNGTFLNGLRLNSGNGITLREGDAIDVGGTHFLFGEARAPSAVELPGADDRVEASFSLEDLLRDGRKALGQDAAACELELDQEIASRFSGVAPALALGRTLELLAGRLEVDVAAVFFGAGSHRLQLAAARPSPRAARDLVAVARRAALQSCGILSLTPPSHRPIWTSDTCRTTLERSYAAAPFMVSACQANSGFLAVERLAGKRLDRKELAFLALFGDRMGPALRSRGGPEDTPITELDADVRARLRAQEGSG
ncbi:FHA domain-containing protein [bacterium]|nr:FHA domain-containing protein [bacterium]